MKKYELLLVFLIVLLGGFLRFYRVDKDPPGLYIDEASIGYNAYSILKTGKDEYGKNLPLFFKSFGDYKLPVYIYAVSAAMIFLGKNELAVRFPSALAGTFTILLFYFFVEKIMDIDKSKIPIDVKKYLPILSTLLLTVSSWHIHFSRGGFEANLAVFFFWQGPILFWFLWREKRQYIY